jgi:SSS family solute:Na+ symporter
MADAASNDTQITAVWQEFEQLNAASAITQYTVFAVGSGLQDNQPEQTATIEAYNARVREAATAAGVTSTVKQYVGYKYDSAFGLLIGRLVPVGLRGFILAAILGAVVSSLASMLNSASTIFTMDLYRQYINKTAAQKTLVAVGRICVGVFVVIGCVISPLLGNPQFKGIFTYIQEFQGFISPGILAVFVFGFLVRKAPPVCGVVGLLINPLVYGVLKLVLPGLAFLDRMAVSFFGVLAVMMIITMAKPLAEPVVLPTHTTIALETSKSAKVAGIAVVIVTLVLYAIFW